MANQHTRSRFRRNLGPIICTLIYVVVLVQLFAEDTITSDLPGDNSAILAMGSTEADYYSIAPRKIADLAPVRHSHDEHGHKHTAEKADVGPHTHNGATERVGSSASSCKEAKCEAPRFVYFAGDREFIQEYCEEHAPRCNSLSCNEVVEHSYSGGTPLKFCPAHRSTCHHEGCYNRASMANSIFQENKPRFCPDHTQECSNPTCDKPKLSRVTRDGYEAYCREHEHTCQRKNCYDEAMPGNSAYHNGYSRFCEKHTEKCVVPSCNHTRKRMAMSNAFYEVCEDHEMICDVAGCFVMSEVDHQKYSPGMPKYCASHTERCVLLDCHNPRALKSRGRGREFYCDEHILAVAVARD